MTLAKFKILIISLLCTCSAVGQGGVLPFIDGRYNGDIKFGWLMDTATYAKVYGKIGLADSIISKYDSLSEGYQKEIVLLEAKDSVKSGRITRLEESLQIRSKLLVSTDSIAQASLNNTNKLLRQFWIFPRKKKQDVYIHKKTAGGGGLLILLILLL